VSSEVFGALDHYLWKLTYKWAKHSHPNKPTRWKARPRGASHAASRALTCSASCLVWQNATRSSAYAEGRIMPTVVTGALVSGAEAGLRAA
jgi:hypothetical protein